MSEDGSAVMNGVAEEFDEDNNSSVPQQRRDGLLNGMKRWWGSTVVKIVFFGLLHAIFTCSNTIVWNYCTTLLKVTSTTTTTTVDLDDLASSSSLTTTTTEATEDGMNLGFIAMAMNAATISGLSVVAVLIVERLGIRLSILISIISQAVFTISCVTHNSVLFLLTAPCFGFAVTLMSNAQSTYCSAVATDPKTVGRLLGLFWSISSLGGISANFLVSSLTSLSFSLESIFLGATAGLFIPSLMLVVLPKVSLSHSSTSSSTAGHLKVLRTLWNRTKQTLKLLRTLKMWAMIPALMIFGTTNSFYASLLSPIIGAQTAGIAWTVSQIVRLVTLQVSGVLADLIPRVILSLVGGLMFVVADICVWFIVADVAVWLPITMAVFVALGEACLWSGVVSPALTHDFGDYEGAWSLNRIIWPLGSIICMTVGPNVPVHAFDLGHFVWVIVLSVCLVIYSLLIRKRPQDSNNDIITIKSSPILLESISSDDDDDNDVTDDVTMTHK